MLCSKWFTLIAVSLLTLQVHAMNCTDPVEDCSGNGYCLSPRACRCFDNYITFPAKNQVPQCNYKQTTALAPFLLQFFLGWFTGVGPFMLGQYPFAIAELLVCTPLMCILCGAVFKFMNHDKDFMAMCSYCLSCFCVLAIFGLWISSLIFIGTFQWTDVNGAPISNWT